MSKNYDLLRRIGDIQPDRHRDLGTPVRPLVVNPQPMRARRKAKEDADLDLHVIWEAIVRRRIWIYCCTAAAISLAALVCALMPRQYKAESRVEVLRQSTGGLSLPNDAAAGNGSDDLSNSLNIDTKASVLESDALAWQVLREVKLVDSKNVPVGPDQSTAYGSKEEKQAARVFQRFKQHLKIDPVSGTRLISVSYIDQDPRLAANIVNRLVSDFVDYTFQLRYNATNKATDWLSGQLEGMKVHVEQAEAHAADLQKTSGIFGADENHNIVISRLEQLNNEVTAAEADRVLKESLYKLCREGDLAAVAEMLGSSSTNSGSSQTANAAALLNSLRQQEATLSAEVADASVKYGPAYPKLVQLNQRLASVRSSIAAELATISNRAKHEYELASAREAAAKSSFGMQKIAAAEMNDRAIDFRLAKHDADSSRELYESLRQKLQEAGVLAGLRSSDIQIVDPATVPIVPYRPNVPLYLAVGAITGLCFGLIAVFVADTSDQTVRDLGTFEANTSVPLIGVVPEVDLQLRAQDRNPAILQGLYRNENSLPSGLRDPRIAEAFRAVRTSLLLSSSGEGLRGEHPRVFMVASGLAGEGKSFASLNLAAALACNGSRVLLVDTDLRRATLSRSLAQHGGKGLSDLLVNDAIPQERSDAPVPRELPGIPGVTFMPAGDCPPGAAELLASPTMRSLLDEWREQFKFIVLDTSAVLPVSDAVALAPRADEVIVVVRFALSTLQSVGRTIGLLKRVHSRHVSVLVNGIDSRQATYYDYHYPPYGVAAGESQLLVPPSSTMRSE